MYFACEGIDNILIYPCLEGEAGKEFLDVSWLGLGVSIEKWRWFLVGGVICGFCYLIFFSIHILFPFAVVSTVTFYILQYIICR